MSNNRGFNKIQYSYLKLFHKIIFNNLKSISHIMLVEKKLQNNLIWSQLYKMHTCVGMSILVYICVCIWICVCRCIYVCVLKIGKTSYKILSILSLNIRIIGDLNFLLCDFLYLPHFLNEHVLLWIKEKHSSTLHANSQTLDSNTRLHGCMNSLILHSNPRSHDCASHCQARCSNPRHHYQLWAAKPYLATPGASCSNPGHCDLMNHHEA